eukprot:COSAG01_NODE_8717_length_2687_cov_1.817233_2_plen_154_part_00
MRLSGSHRHSTRLSNRLTPTPVAETKNQWARDDPAFVVVLVTMVAVASLAYAIAFRVSSLWMYLRVVISAIVFDFFAVGFFVATAAWWARLGRIYLLQPPYVVAADRCLWLGAAGGSRTPSCASLPRSDPSPSMIWDTQADLCALSHKISPVE